MPFTSLRLNAPRPRVLPRGYPTSLVTLGDHIRRRRLDLRLLQRTLADLWRATRETVAGWELGRYQPSVRQWPLLIAFLGHDPTAVEDTVADQLRALRRRHGLTQAELAARAGLDEGTILDLEVGRRTTSARVMASVELLLR